MKVSISETAFRVKTNLRFTNYINSTIEIARNCGGDDSASND